MRGTVYFSSEEILLIDSEGGVMANEALERSGMFFDDLNRIRVLDEETSSQVGK